ncbi:LysR family transcriptional regulator [Herbaspirillum seropedicae]|uniref:LysR family transcription regulator protein n=1 Tax=Herbaspirillum seropedicae (strain SmR1) TaxID=757424 RepID=D8IPF6_HERSS|nr:LysR family transcriptional regulator [Herbaspirillum seropedicae]ADJ62976.1 LysR family transcription regulator protein [Herbaspirillum seropedicae SmR1]AON53697.1 LysR family transcription regulator protein [Herbaspirillum seropedicae]MDR6396792.1 DNA-binding transcriptional LysR family regulator [Herbaspirillum seropedicae]QDD63932.1 LysR family transcriptional regulator [Herbaspirillum seropedicae]UMU21011.1 LysR family transcriptional regulator [Herbaspirillum seropedicae]
MRINIETAELQAFIAVARQSSFRAAAEGLFITQPALSRRIENLEQALQERLFDRTTRRVSLTPAGELFLVHAQAVMEELELAVKSVEQRMAQRREHVTVACVPSVANNLLPQVLKRYARSHANVRVRIIDESAADVLESVRKGEADFGVNFIGAQEAEIDFAELTRERYLAVMPTHHPLAAHASLNWKSLAGEKLVSVSSSSGNRSLIDNAFSRVPQRPVIQYETNHVAGAISLVAAGLGVALLPELAIRNAPYKGIVARPVTSPVLSRAMGLITLKGRVLKPAAATLAQALRDAISTRSGK